MSRCGYCGGELIWNGDFDYYEVYGEGEGIVSYYTCSNEDCGAEVELFFPTDEDD